MTSNSNREDGSGFLPEKYTVPNNSGSNYMKLREGDNRIRILGSPLLGWVYWEDTPDGRRPVRCPMDNKPTAPDVRHFWAVPVLDYQSNGVSVLEISQKTIQEGIRDFAKDADWGNPRDYDITITRKGAGLDTEYSLRPSPKVALTDEQLEFVKATPVCLEALFENGNPFEEQVTANP
jgi:hypothetical protein